MKCPKCGSEARDIARFCPRCHATLRFECPACHHEQRHGETCEKCGADFIKYIAAIVATKRAEADLIHDRIERRSSLMTSVFWVPLTAGVSLLRHFLVGSRDRT
jgi:NMD protein affecting ribosome stability and mRNA decay